MKQENFLNLIAGLLLGVLLMLFWQLNSKINFTSARISQLEQVTTTTSASITEVVEFLNKLAGQAENLSVE